MGKPTGKGCERLRRRWPYDEPRNVEILLDAVRPSSWANESVIVMCGKSTSISNSESLELAEDGHVRSEDVRQDEPSLWKERSDKAELGGGEEHNVDPPTNTLKLAPSTGVRSSPSRTSPSLEETSSASGKMETSSASGKMTTLRWARLVFTEKSDRPRSVRGGVLETGESSTLSSGRVPNPGVA
jgi:hypothetical protein